MDEGKPRRRKIWSLGISVSLAWRWRLFETIFASSLRRQVLTEVVLVSQSASMFQQNVFTEKVKTTTTRFCSHITVDAMKNETMKECVNASMTKKSHCLIYSILSSSYVFADRPAVSTEWSEGKEWGSLSFWTLLIRTGPELYGTACLLILFQHYVNWINLLIQWTVEIVISLLNNVSVM